MFNVKTNERLLKALDAAAYLFLLLQVFLLPLFLDKRLLNFYVLPKQAVFVGLLLINVLLWAVKVILAKRIVYRRSVLDMPLLILFLGFLFSAIFSVGVYDSFLGRTDWFGMSFTGLAFSVLFYFVLVNQVSGYRQWRRLLDVLLASGAVAATLFLLKAVFKFSLPGWEGVWNTVDGANGAFGVWTVFHLFLAAAFFVRQNLGKQRFWFYLFLILLHAAVLLVLGFGLLWWFLLAGLILALLLGVLFLNEARIWRLSFLFVLFIAAAVFIVFGSPRALQGQLPAEVSLSFKSSWSIAVDTLFSGVKNFIVGSGQGTFGADFSRFKTLDFNYNQLAWSARFSQPANAFLAILSEGGAVIFLSFVFVFLFVLGHAWQILLPRKGVFKRNTLRKMISGEVFDKDGRKMEAFVLLGGWLLLWIGMFFVFFGATLWWLWWLVLGLLITGLQQSGGEVVKEKAWAMEETPQHNLVFSFALIIIMAALVMLGVLGARFYLAEYNYARALSSNDLASAERYLDKAISQRGNFDIYHVALARVYLLQAAEEMKNKEPSPDKVAALVAQAVNRAKVATDLSSQSVAIWENLATMYENAAILVPQAKDWAIKSLNQALDLEPNNPVLYWRLGNIYFQAGDQDKAMENYKKALEVKRDYLGAYVGIAAIYEKKQDLDKAIENYSVILPSAGNNPEVLFNLGRLYYNRRQKGDWGNAEKLWLEAVRLQPGYSNALYSLGLFYENQEDMGKALEYYYKVKDINPGNKEIIGKISNLLGQPAATETTQ